MQGVGCRTGGMQDRMDAGKEGCRKGGIGERNDEERRDEEKDVFRTEKIQDWRQEEYMKGKIQD